MLPKLDPKRAQFVLTKIDEILAWEQRKDSERDTKFVELGRYVCEVRAGQYWRLENLKSFDEFLERRFPESRRKAYYLMSIHEHLPPQARKDLKEIGWTKGRELAKLARAEGQQFECAPWVHKARSMPREEFAREVEKELTGRDSEPHEIIYFKIYKSQIPSLNKHLRLRSSCWVRTSPAGSGEAELNGLTLSSVAAGFPLGSNRQLSGVFETLRGTLGYSESLFGYLLFADCYRCHELVEPLRSTELLGRIFLRTCNLCNAPRIHSLNYF